MKWLTQSPDENEWHEMRCAVIPFPLKFGRDVSDILLPNTVTMHLYYDICTESVNTFKE